MDVPGLDSASLLDLYHAPIPALFEGIDYPWQAIPRIAECVAALVAAPPPGFRVVTEGVIAGEGATVSSRADFEGPAVIGPGCEVRKQAYIRENVLLGTGCIIGNSTELKNCVLFDLSQAAHFNFVSDSILGFRVHLGAGAVLTNYKSNGSLITVRGPEGLRIATGLVRFGAVLGDRVEIGCNAVCNPGSIVGRDTSVYPLCCVRGVIPARSIVKRDGIVSARLTGKRGP